MRFVKKCLILIAMDIQLKLIELLKKKGTGETMGKSLLSEDLAILPGLFKNPEGHLTTKATLAAALLMLSPTPEEALFIKQIQTYLPDSLTQLFFGAPQTAFETLIQQVLKQNDLNAEEMKMGINATLDPAIPEYLKAVFLEAERLKRETETENTACYDILYQKATHTSVHVPLLIDLSNGYDGLNRTPYSTLYLAPLLASIGFPTVLHGTHEVAPKRGENAHKLLKLAGKNPLQSLQKCKEELEESQIGWTYIDQAISFPELHQLTELRANMVKRPILATVEKLLQPMIATGQNYLVTSYTHPPYKEKMIAILRHQNRYDKNLLFRGQEGSIQLPMDRPARYLVIDKTTVEEDFVKSSNFKDPLIYMATTILKKLNLEPNRDIEADLTHSIETGLAQAHFERALND